MGASVYSHRGPVEDIPPTASPGLLFLQRFLPALDSLDPAAGNLVSSFLAPNATFDINGNVTPADQMLPMFEMRGTSLSKFGHRVAFAWDIEHIEEEADKQGSGKKSKRTVMYESTSFSVFKNDPDQVEAKVREFNVIELEEDVDAEPGKLRATALRGYMDPQPVKDRAQACSA